MPITGAYTTDDEGSMDFHGRAREMGEELVALRRDLHRHPELSFREERTAGIAAGRARELGYRVRESVGRTGVVADLPGDGPLVALRADMDALPIDEEAEHDYASTVPGVMHACGHDAHTAALVGAAAILAGAREAGELPPGGIRLLFQPSEEAMDEEGKSGATRMIEDGAMEGVDAVVGAHVGAHLPPGKLFFRSGPMMAGMDTLRVEVRGVSSHAARPEEGVDAVVLAAQGVVAAQQGVSRRVSPLEKGVLTLGTIEGGTAENIIADRVHLTGTVRYFDEDVRRRLHEAVEGAFRAAEAMGGRSSVEVVPGYPPLVNDPEVVRILREAAAGAFGADAVYDFEPFMGAEDFAFLAREAPGGFFWVGAAPGEGREHHHPRFDIDESAIPLAAAALARGAVALLRGLG